MLNYNYLFFEFFAFKIFRNKL